MSDERPDRARAAETVEPEPTGPRTVEAPDAENGNGAPGFLARAWQLSVIPAIAIVLALVTGAVIMIASSPLVGGELDPSLPFVAYWALARGAFGSLNGLTNVLVSASPLVLTGLAVGVGFKAGLFNIGAQGQFLMGALVATAVGVALSAAPGPVAISLAVLAGAAAGTAWGFIPGFLKAFTGAHEVVTTIMLNFVAVFTIAYLITGPMRAVGASFARSADVGNATLPILFGRNAHIGILIAFLTVPVVWWILYRSTLGFEIRTVGANPDAARYAGMHPRLLVILTMSLAGLFAGLAGGIEVLGIVHHMPASFATTVGFDGIAVALLGRAHPFGIFFAALLFGAMRAGSGLMQIEAGIPVQMVDVLQAVILFFLAAELIVRKVIRVRAAGTGVSELETVTRSYGEQAAR